MKKLFSWKMWWFWVAIAVLLRVAIMPFTGHNDLYSTYVKSSYLAFDGRMFPSKFALIWLYFHAAVLKLYSLFWPGIVNVLPSDPQTMASNNQSIFLNELMFRLTFLLKLPYLLLELVTIKIFISFFKSSKEKFVTLLGWIFNPYMYYSLYVYGRNEILVVFFLVTFFWFARKKKFLVSSLLLGASVAVRLFTVILAPFYLVFVANNFKERVKHGLLVMVPLVFSVLIRYLFADTAVMPFDRAPINIDFFLPVNIGVGHGLVVYLLLAALIHIWLYVWFHAKMDWSQLWAWLSAVLFFSLGLMFFHPQYFAWITPFMVWLLIKLPKRRSELLTVYALQLVGWLLTLLFWGDSVTVSLLSPINPHLFKELGSPMAYLARFLEFFNPVNLGRTMVFSAHMYLVYMIMPLIRINENVSSKIKRVLGRK
jgi:hypothetical protein